jgi:hypothetical protein
MSIGAGYLIPLRIIDFNHMKKIKFYYLFVLIPVLLVAFYSCETRYTSGDVVFIENGKIKLGFEKRTGRFVSFTDVENSCEFIEGTLVDELPWEIKFHSSSPESAQDDPIIPSKFRFSKPDPLTLTLTWEGFDGIKGLRVEAKVSLGPEKALSYWRIEVDGLEGTIVENVLFPVVKGIKEMGDEKLATAGWMGSLMKNPREVLAGSNASVKRLVWPYPGSLSMQLIALYNPDKKGLYLSANDSLSYVKNFSLTLDTLNTLVYRIENFPPFVSALDSYSPSYEAVIGSFTGDWITAAERYREWGIQQQWCKESRFHNKQNPSWLDSTALWVWNRNESDNVLKPAVALKKTLGLPVSVFWHWWHNCLYDDNFPEYFPPREGGKSFIDAVTSAQKEGVRCIVYMNHFQWGDKSESWERENAEPFTARDINGKMNSHVYNIFTGNSLTNMCIATDFWRNKYSSLCDSAVNVYQTNGVYMDQACLSRMCYDNGHGHVPGGGNYWVDSFGKLTSQIRTVISDKTQPVLAGEGSGENWIPYLDAFLTLPVSRERYSGIGNTEVIPLFQAVYHKYAVTYGSYSSLVTPPYNNLWPEEYRPENTEKLLDEKFNKQFFMEQARSFVWGMQPTIANYHTFLNSDRKQEMNYLMDIVRIRYKNLKYLLYGDFCRNPEIQSPVEKINISRLSIYVGRKGNSVTTFEKEVPVLYAGTWKSEDNNLGIAMASISDDPIPVDFSFKSGDYGLASKGEVYITTNKGKELLTSYTNGSVNVKFLLESRGLCVIEVVPSIL